MIELSFEAIRNSKLTDVCNNHIFCIGEIVIIDNNRFIVEKIDHQACSVFLNKIKNESDFFLNILEKSIPGLKGV